MPAMPRLDPTAPMLWRSPTSLQFGDPALARLDHVSPAVERVLAACLSRFEWDDVAAAAAESGMAPDELGALLDAVAPAILDDVPAPRPLVALLRGPADLVAVVGAGLGSVAAWSADRPGAAGVRVLVAPHVLTPRDYLPLLSADIPHIRFVVGDRSIEVGPLVVPGRTPCLRCLDEHRLDADPHWPVVAAQLLGRPVSAPPGDPALLAAAAMLGLAFAAVSATRSTILTDAVIRLDRRSGAVSRLPHEWHERCSCRMPLPLPDR